MTIFLLPRTAQITRSLFNPKLPVLYRSYFINSHHARVDDDITRWKTLPVQPLTPRLLIKSLGELSKFKLSALVVLTTMSGHIMATTSTTYSPSTLGLTLLGTALCSFSANSLNQWAEAPLDAQMPRTQNRPLPRLVLTPFAAFNWALAAGTTGLSILALGVNPMAAGLAGLTIVLYAGLYTPLKRISILNTWVGALVGAIPPLIGWTAASPHITLSSLILPAVLFCWQFPHFNALSWNLRGEYARAGYKMASVLNPRLNGRVALRYSIALIPVTLIAAALGLTTPLFALTGNMANASLVFKTVQFWRDPTRKSARGLFFASLLHLPLFLTLLFIHKSNSAIVDSGNSDTSVIKQINDE